MRVKKQNNTQRYLTNTQINELDNKYNTYFDYSIYNSQTKLPVKLLYIGQDFISKIYIFYIGLLDQNVPLDIINNILLIYYNKNVFIRYSENTEVVKKNKELLYKLIFKKCLNSKGCDEHTKDSLFCNLHLNCEKCGFNRRFEYCKNHDIRLASLK